jgi:2',3'-cyclic-nucleotide 2'-phosphodiesterase (5'-nucleotidase family)
MAKKFTYLKVLTTAALLTGLASMPAATFASSNNTAKSTLKLRIMETTDIHVNLVNYDYYKDKATDEFGFAKTATLIKNAREEQSNHLLFDNGDLIQGNPLGDYVAKINPLQQGETHPVYKAMNLLDYDAGNIGNHEFNYGLDFLQTSLDGANFPYVSANVYIDDHDDDPSNDKNYFKPYEILDRTFVDENGKEQKIKVGVIGFVPPQIEDWDKAHLEGKVIAKDIVETAEKFVPKMKKEGADIIVAIPHSGFEKATPKGNDENSVYYLSNVKGIDAILFGHAHKVFPGPGFEGIEGIDNKKGTINGIAAVEPGTWGDHLGVIDMTLEKNGIPKIFWGKTLLKETQIGRLSINKRINLWKKDEDGNIHFERILNPGEQYRVYGYDSAHGGQYNVGAGYFVTNMPTHVKYETPSKAKLAIIESAGKWKVVDSQSEARAIYDKTTNAPLVEADQQILDAVKDDHEGTLEYIRGAVGETTAPINSYFALVNDDPSIQIVTNAQKWYVENKIQGTEYDGLPVLSVGAPFKAGGRNGVSYYTDIPAGEIAVKNVADLYVYPNTVKAVLLSGDQVKEWIEMSAGQFNQIDPSKTEEQNIVNNDFPTYNFDVIDGVEYQIDVTQPAKYNKAGEVVNPSDSRVKNLTFQGKTVTAEQKFVVVTNNYRASGGGNFPGLDGSNIIIDSPDENRQVILDYIMDKKVIDPAADGNWAFAPTAGNIVFESSPIAKDFATQVPTVEYVETLENGFAKFKLNLDK